MEAAEGGALQAEDSVSRTKRTGNSEAVPGKMVCESIGFDFQV